MMFSLNPTAVGGSLPNQSIVERIRSDIYGRLYLEPINTPAPGDLAEGTNLLLLGTTTDISGYGNHASPTGSNQPQQIIGIDNQPALLFSSSVFAPLAVQPFLSTAQGATLFAVYTPNQSQFHNIIHTFPAGDGWWAYGNVGYMGVFKYNRLEQQPSFMPSAGIHLVTVHSSPNWYKVTLDRATLVSMVMPSGQFFVGTNFTIAGPGPAYNGQISLIAVVPEYWDISDERTQRKFAAIKARFPSLPYSV